ncbi:MAG: phosphoribosylformylglycinamidine cyclo-ligase [Acidimicrobiia bacterium]|nr:MAG: phosphoribosylformylglycinamidine cyclo-ligase [Acidimicrobiia bacterium]
MTREGGPLTYGKAGVDVSAAARLLDRLSPVIGATRGPEWVDHPSPYAGLIRPETGTMADPLIAATCDGVGTKLLLARGPADFEGLGVDLVAMSVNDLLPLAARPILFLDYLATARLDPERIEAAIRGIAAGCREAGCALLGGETAEMPGMYPDGELEMVGFAVGMVDAELLPDPTTARPGDAVVGLPSTGLHSNGFSLARAALLERGGLDLDHEVRPGMTLGDELLTPTAIYVRPVLDLAATIGFKAAAHVTGGGLLGRAGAMLPTGLEVRIDPAGFTRPPVIDLVATHGGVEEAELAATFNMGLGFLAVIAADDTAAAVELGWRLVGEVTDGKRRVVFGDVAV